MYRSKSDRDLVVESVKKTMKAKEKSDEDLEMAEEEEEEEGEDDLVVQNNIPYFKIMSFVCFLLAIIVYFL